MRTFDRYKMNLKADDNNIYSYNTIIGIIDHENKTITEVKWWEKITRFDLQGSKFEKQSPTTATHLNFVASEYNYKVIKSN